MKKTLIRTGVAAALACGVAMAQAGTVDLTGWAFGTGNDVSVTGPAGLGDNGRAGAFTGSLTGFGAPFDTASFTTYCVDLAKDFNLPSGQMTYNIISGASDTASFASSGWGSNAAATSARLGQLLTYVNAHATTYDTSIGSTEVQLAIWNIIYDTDNTVAGGAFHANTSGTPGFEITAADALLSASLNTPSNLYVYVLQSATHQNFIVTTAVPEPSTYGLMLAGLAGVGFVARRRAKR